MITLQNHNNVTANFSVTSIVQRISDISIISLSFYFLCFVHQSLFTDQNLFASLIAVFFFLTFGGLSDFYRSWRGIKLSVEIFTILRNWTVTFGFTWVTLRQFTDLSLPSATFVQWFIIVALGLIVCRTFIRLASRTLRKYGVNTRRVCIAGSMPAGIALLKSFSESPWLGFIVKGVYDDVCRSHLDGIPFAGDLSRLVDEAREGKIDRVYISMSMKEEDKISELVKRLTDTTCSVFLVPDMSMFNVLHSETKKINGIPIVPLFDTPFIGINSVLKRLEDIVVASIVLCLISPVLLMITCAVKFSSPGPAIFRQKRYGMDGKAITVWKFRSMSVMENGGSVTQATKHDLRVTPVGRFLRKTSLDELPQFFNVLFGQMSVVGPRPHAVAHNEQYRFLIQGYMLRHKVKPGITGLAQISGWRGETDTLEKMQKRIDCDLEYIRTWSVWVDLKIIFLTIFKGFLNKSAY